MKICVTGASGSIGSALAERLYRTQHKDLLFVDQDETGIFYLSAVLRGANCRVGDIVNKKRMEKFFKEFKPDVIYHCAAYKHVPVMEKQKEEAIENNIYGTKNLIELAIKYKVKKFVLISTDKAVNPTTVMGKTKRICEQMCLAQKSKTKFVIVRFGNVLYSRGSVLPTFEEKIKQKKAIEITSKDMERYFIKMQNAISLILEAGKGKNRELYIWDMGKQKKIVEMAQDLMKKMGKKTKIIYTKPRGGEKFSEELFNEGEHPIKKGKLFVAQLPYQKINLKKLIKKI